MSSEITEGTIIEAPWWPEPVEVKKIREVGSYLQVIGVMVHSGTHVDRLVPKAEFTKKAKTKTLALDFSAPGDEIFLSLEAFRYRLASIYDSLLAMNVSKIDPLPFQIDAVYGKILKLPRIRFLLADDPGAGKTIMAGLVLKELKLRGLAKRILIVVPGHLKDQWRREMKEKFGETFVVLDRAVFDARYGENPWVVENQVITSMDFAKRDEILPSLQSAGWDLVIVDEAHKMAAYPYGKHKTKRTERYRLGEVLSRNSTHLLFLTATPHKGDPGNFRLFMDLLEPGFFATDESIEESLRKGDNPLWVRRMKEDLRDFEGKPIFTRRFPRTLKFRLSEDEHVLYNELSKYVISQYNKALANDRKRNVAFALLILQRRMASSVYALWKSLQRREKKLRSLLERPSFEPEEFRLLDFEEVEDLEESERWTVEEKWETLSVAANRQELIEEIETVNRLKEMASKIIEQESEVKLRELKKAIEEGFRKIQETGGEKKILIFTESKDTLEYLVKKIKSWGYRVNWIHGGMRIEDRIRAEGEFRHRTQVMVATEAAGEGINLQFCNIVINYDIPWNPNRLEQRMGRVHRYGQTRDVYIFNLVAENTREGKVLIKLLDKLEEIRRALGREKVFDVIGEIFREKRLAQLIQEAVANARSLDDIIKELDIKVDEKYIQQIKEKLGESLATRHIDYTRIREMFDRAKEHRLIPEYVEAFFKKAFEKAGGKVRTRKDGFLSVDSVPWTLRKIAEDPTFRSRYGPLLKSYSKITFDKETAFKHPDVEFVSFGHPLLEAVLEWVWRNFSEGLRRGAVFEDPSGVHNGMIWFYEGTVIDGKGEIAGRKLFAVYDDGKELKEINPTILWDLVPKREKSAGSALPSERPLEFVIKALEKYKEELLVERQRQAAIKRKYGLRSLDYLIAELDADLARLYERQAMGEKVDLPIRNKEERKKQYEIARKELEKKIEQETSLTFSMPRLIGAIRVRAGREEEMVSDAEIERIGMEIAMEYERRNGRIPEDVSAENLGFDIRSRGKGEIRYIEVKARRGEGDLALTPNELFKAKRFKEKYWLYVVSNAASNPTLWIINNPAKNLKVLQKVEVVRFIVPIREWKQKAVMA
jgi:superfamily II DNA or RNA helicase